MARIKKQGLDYFPLDTDFMQQRAVRRLMKQQGDRAFTVLLSALSAIYGGEGYYVRADRTFCEDLAADLFDTDDRQVENILRMAVSFGLFDEHLYQEHGILTSAHIQEQYLFCCKRRRKRQLDERFRLVENAQEEEEKETAADAPEAENVAQKAENVTQTPENATQTPENATLIPQSKAQQSIAQQSKGKPLPTGSPDTGGTGTGDGRTPPPTEDGETHDGAWWTRRIAQLAPPADHRPRNYDNLLLELRRWKIPPQEQYALILRSSFGLIGHPVWLGLSEMLKKPGCIRQPGKFLLSKCK